MKHSNLMLVAAFSLAAFTLWGESASAAAQARPLRGGRAAATFKDSGDSAQLRQDARKARPRDMQKRRASRRQNGVRPQFQPGPGGFARGGGRGVGPAPGFMPRGWGGPPMMNQNRPWGRGQFLPPSSRGLGQRSFAPGVGPWRRGFGGPPMMRGRGPMARRDWAPPAYTPRRPEAGPLRRGLGRPPMMNQNRPWGRGQFLPPSSRGLGQRNGAPGFGPLRRGLGGPPWMNRPGPQARRDLAPSSPRQGRPGAGLQYGRQWRSGERGQPSRPNRNGQEDRKPERDAE